MSSTLPSELPCPKCGSKNISRYFRNKDEEWSEHGIGIERESEYVIISKWAGKAKKDCIIHHCQCCQFEWETKSLPSNILTENITASPAEFILNSIASYGGVDGEHHKQWLINEIVQYLTGDNYDQWVTEWENGEDGPKTYIWGKGIAP